MAQDILERLRHRLDVYAKTEHETEFGELTWDYEKIQTVWGELLPVRGKEEDIDGQSIRANVTHKVSVRRGAIKEPRNDMYFMYQGQKYEVQYFMPQFRRNDLIIFYTKLVIETEEEYSHGTEQEDNDRTTDQEETRERYAEERYERDLY